MKRFFAFLKRLFSRQPEVPATPVKIEPQIFTKRVATEEEEALAVLAYSQINEKDYTEELASCKAEGLTTEICSCERVLPAFIHYVRCPISADRCPMKSKSDQRSLLEMMFDSAHDVVE
jgi:hypothetical protein